MVRSSRAKALPCRMASRHKHRGRTIGPLAQSSQLSHSLREYLKICAVSEQYLCASELRSNHGLPRLTSNSYMTDRRPSSSWDFVEEGTGLKSIKARIRMLTTPAMCMCTGTCVTSSHNHIGTGALLHLCSYLLRGDAVNTCRLTLIKWPLGDKRLFMARRAEHSFLDGILETDPESVPPRVPR